MEIVLGLLFILFNCALALIPAGIAKKKGYSFGLFFLFGFFTLIGALIAAIVLKPKKGYTQPQTSSTQFIYPSAPSPKQCQYCASLNQADTLKCANCGAPLA